MHLTVRFTKALEYACQLHAQQVRKGSGAPYVAHLLAVAAIALEHGAGEDEAIAALLHDAVEDQGGSSRLVEIRERFGSAVAHIVDGCTDADTIPKPPWRQRKEQYLARLGSHSRSVHLVCAADKLHNVRSVIAEYRQRGESLWQFFNGGRDGTLWYYRTIADKLRELNPGPLVDELDRAVRELEQLVAARGPK